MQGKKKMSKQIQITEYMTLTHNILYVVPLTHNIFYNFIMNYVPIYGYILPTYCILLSIVHFLCYHACFERPCNFSYGCLFYVIITLII